MSEERETQEGTQSNSAEASQEGHGARGQVDFEPLEGDYLLEGMSLSVILENFVRFIHGNDITFIGGPYNLYYAWSSVEYIYDKNTGQRKQLTTFQDYATHNDGRFLGNSITTYNPVVLIPLHAAYLIGERYPQTGQQIVSIPQCSELVARDVIGVASNTYCTISKRGSYANSDIQLNYVRTPAFTLDVPADSVLADKFEIAVEPGHSYTCVAAAHMAVIPRLTEGSYRIRYGGRGIGGYYCDTTLDLRVVEYSQPHLTRLLPPADPEGILDLDDVQGEMQLPTRLLSSD